MILKNIIRKTLSALIAVSVLTLNLSGILQCTSLTMTDDCCHITKIVKPCCAKNLKITFKERITGHCGCTMEESQQTADLYNDVKYSNHTVNSKVVQYNSAVEAGYHPELIRINTSDYSPPVKDCRGSYLENLSIRI